MNQWPEEKFPLMMQWILDVGNVFEISQEEAEVLWTLYIRFEIAFTRRQRKREAARKQKSRTSQKTVSRIW